MATRRPRSLPVRVAPVAGEALDSWLDAYSARLDATIGEVRDALGLLIGSFESDRSAITLLLRQLSGGQIAAVEAATAVAAVSDLTLARFQAIFPRIVNRPQRAGLWRVVPGSRHCPQCLADTGGRWQLTWRLPWVFACNIHECLLVDVCAGCQRRARSRLPKFSLVATPTRCQQPLRRTDPGRKAGIDTCGTDLTKTAVDRLASDDRRLATQRSLTTLLMNSDASATGVGVAVDVKDLFVDLGIIAGHVLAAKNRNNDEAWLSAAQAANALTVALSVTNADSITTAAELLAPLLPDLVMRRSGANSSALPATWRTASIEVQQAVLKARHPYLRPADRLRYGTITVPRPSPPEPGDLSSQRHRKLPQNFWPTWTLRLMPTSGHDFATYGPALAACTMLPGSQLTLRDAAGRVEHGTTGPHIAHILNGLHRDGNADTVMAAIAELADHLDATVVPIDYQRRRQTFIQNRIDPLPLSAWDEMCDVSGTRKGVPSHHRHASRYVTEILTGNNLDSLPEALRFHDSLETFSYHLFCEKLTQAEVTLLRDHASRLLASQGINEPLTWEPPVDWLPAGLDYPGPVADSLPHDQLVDLLVTRRLTAQRTAEQLGTTIDHVRLAVRLNPVRPDRPAGLYRRASPRQPGGATTKKWARTGLLSDEQVRYRYEQCGWSWRKIATEAGCSKQTVIRTGKAAGITSRPGGGRSDLDVEPTWLRHQYLVKRRTLPDIATELHTSPTALARVARELGVPLRGRGGASHAAALTPAIDDLPEWIRPAFQGQHAMERVRRILALTEYRTITEAADALGIHPGTLQTQLHRIETALDTKLVGRAVPYHPMTLTEAGIAVGTALAGGPPHRSQRAGFPHWAPASGTSVEADLGVGVHDV
ncbi:MAG: TniQ family protein, partial [Actinomycetota bacterium]|nr:TniQ family protein [Actinomycetota bacterium]